MIVFCGEASGFVCCLMTINLNDPKDFTPEKVREFLASVDDSQDRQIRITLGGIAFMSDSVGVEHPEGLVFRLATFGAGSGRVGERAAADESWVKRVYEAMRSNWPNAHSTYVDEI